MGRVGRALGFVHAHACGNLWVASLITLMFWSCGGLVDVDGDLSNTSAMVQTGPNGMFANAPRRFDLSNAATAYVCTTVAVAVIFINGRWSVIYAHAVTTAADATTTISCGGQGSGAWRGNVTVTSICGFGHLSCP